jgi:hypothetical protein
VDEKSETYELPVGAPVKGDVKVQLLANKKVRFLSFLFVNFFVYEVLLCGPPLTNVNLMQIGLTLPPLDLSVPLLV